MIGAGKSEGSIDVSSVLKPYLARGVIKCIGATTIEEYEMYIEKDRALERRFQIITIREPDVEDTIKMLKAKKKEYEDFHNVKIQEKVLEQIVKYCAYYMPQRKFPDKAIAAALIISDGFFLYLLRYYLFFVFVQDPFYLTYFVL